MNVFIFAANWYNRGDESAIRAMIDELRIKYPDCSIKMHFNQDVYDIPYKDIEIIPTVHMPRHRYILKYILYYVSLFCGLDRIYGLNKDEKGKFAKIIDAIAWADIAIYAPGGPCIGDIYRQYLLVYLMILIHKSNTPFFVYAPSVGPFKRYGKYIKTGLDKASVLCFREKISQAYFKKLSPEKETIVTLDSAFQHDIDMVYNEKIFDENQELKDYFNKYEKVVGITITDLQWHQDYQKTGIEEIIRNSFEGLISYLRSKGYGVIFIPQLFGKDDDKTYMESYKVIDEYVLDDNYDCYFQQYLISKCFAVVGMRYHSNIFSAKMGVPFVSVAYEHKMSGFMSLNEIEDYCVPIKDLSINRIIDRFSLLENDYDKYKHSLLMKNKQLKNDSYKTSELLYKLIEDAKIG